MSIARKITAGLSVVLIVATIATSLQAQTPVMRYRQGGAWENLSDGTTPGWRLNDGSVVTAIPGPLDEARVNWAGSTVTLDSEAPTFLRLLIGVDEAGVVEVNDGGVLTTSQDVVVGNNGFVEGYMDVNDGAVVNVGRILWVARGPVVGDVLGFLNINAGGTVNVASHLWWGTTGTAEINISGTLNQTGGILGLGTQNASTPLGGSATVNVLDGGELNLNNISSNPSLPSIQPGSKINIAGTGRLTLPGDFVNVLGAYRDAGRFEGNGVTGAVTIQTEPGGQPAGDFNADGIVDVADYTTWRDSVGLAGLPNSAGLGTVGPQHYDLWVSSYGSTSSIITVMTAGLPPAAASVPEPGAFATAGIVGVLLSGASRRRTRA
jgi:hypothetical protein